MALFNTLTLQLQIIGGAWLNNGAADGSVGMNDGASWAYFAQNAARPLQFFIGFQQRLMGREGLQIAIDRPETIERRFPLSAALAASTASAPYIRMKAFRYCSG